MTMTENRVKSINISLHMNDKIPVLSNQISRHSFDIYKKDFDSVSKKQIEQYNNRL